MTNIINLADHRPPAPRLPSRFSRLARRADDALRTLIVSIGICFLAWIPGHAIQWLVPDLPWYIGVFATGGPAVLVGARGMLASVRLQRRSPNGCSVNVHVYEDEVVTTCKCGATGDVDGGGAAA